MNTAKRQIRAELYIAGDNASAFFHLLHEQKDAVEQDLGYPLELGRASQPSGQPHSGLSE